MARGFVGALIKLTESVKALGMEHYKHGERIAKLEEFRDAATPILWRRVVVPKYRSKSRRKSQKR